MTGRSTTTLLLCVLLLAAVAHSALVQNATRIVPSSNGRIKAFIIPHSHCDPGWIYPMQVYYDLMVSKILTNTIYKISTDPKKRFIWAETSYFKMWYEQQNATTVSLVKKLVDSKQLEFVCGGWVMNDEALPNYSAVINQMTTGHEYLKNELGVKPKIGWQIDPFGASASTAILQKLMGFEYHVINRIDDRLKYQFDTIPGSGQYRTDKLFEFYWQSSKSYPTSTLFTHVLDHHYSSPVSCKKFGTEFICEGFDFEADPATNPPVTPQNIQERASLLVSLIAEIAPWYRTKNVLIPFGNDFRFINPSLEFDNMDLLIDYINKNQSFGVDIQYGTLSDYFDAVKKDEVEQAIQFPVKTYSTGDYFPYTNCWYSELSQFNNCIAYWTGFFSSYPNFKQYVRNMEEFDGIANTLFALLAPFETDLDTLQFDKISSNLQLLREQVALVQHHDAITGTMNLITREDYYSRLKGASLLVSKDVSNLLHALVSEKSPLNANAIKMQKSCSSTTTSTSGTVNSLVVSTISEFGFAPLVLFNSLAWSRMEYVSLDLLPTECNGAEFEVLVSNTESSPSSASKSAASPVDMVASFLPGKVGTIGKTCTAYFAVELLPLAVTTVFIQKKNATSSSNNKYSSSGSSLQDSSIGTSAPKQQLDETISIQNDVLKLTFSLSSGNQLPYQLKSMQYLNSEDEIPITQELMQYTSWGDGAYLFRPVTFAGPVNSQVDSTLQYKLYKGKYVQELAQQVTCNVTQFYRLYTSFGDSALGSFIEIETKLNNTYLSNKEVISRISVPQVKSKAEFYTDQYGFEMIKRTREYRFNDTTVQSFIAGNYYPMVSNSFIRDSTLQVTAYSRHSMGVSSLADGQLEIMLNRNTLTDDGRGVGEAVEDANPVSVTYRITVLDRYASESLRPQIVKRFSTKPLVQCVELTKPEDGTAPIITSSQAYAKLFHTTWHPMQSQFALPRNVHLLSLQNLNSKTVMRLQHLYEAEQDLLFSKPEFVALQNLFNQQVFSISNNVVSEKSLSLLHKLQDYSTSELLEFKPLQIRTFSFDLLKVESSFWNLTSFLIGAVACIAVVALVTVLFFLVKYLCSRRETSEIMSAREESVGEAEPLVNNRV